MMSRRSERCLFVVFAFLLEGIAACGDIARGDASGHDDKGEQDLGPTGGVSNGEANGGASDDGNASGGSRADGAGGGGSSAADGASDEGDAIGGTTSGGASPGGADSGGSRASGGLQDGGNMAGGAASGGSSAGGASSGGSGASGGESSGGNATGGVSAGGSATGGAGAGGSATGGAGAGGSAIGGAASGGGASTDPIPSLLEVPAGNPSGGCAIPVDAGPEDSSSPTTVVGEGSPESCTGDAVIRAVAGGGVITFDCGVEPVVITLSEPAKIFNNTGPEIVIDGGDLVTLSGGGTTRILYMNTCDEDQVWTTDHCESQDHPRLTVQNLTFVDGDSSDENAYDGGGAIWARGGQFKAVNTRFFNNQCAAVGPDVGGAGIRAFSQYNGLPIFITNSTFGGRESLGNSCANGGGISSIGVSWTIINSVFSYNHAVGNGGNPAEPGTPGGGSGGAIYNDGNTMSLSICGTLVEQNEAVQHGSAIFFVSNDHSGDISLEDTALQQNCGGSWYPLQPGISMHDDTPLSIESSSIEECQ